MQKTMPAANPDAYAATPTGWQRAWVENLRAEVCAASGLEADELEQPGRT